MRRRIGIITLSIVGVALVVLVCTALFGTVNGEEFSPDTFDRRTFRYLEVPLIGLQVQPIKRQITTNPLVTYLQTNKLLGTQSKAPQWDLVNVQRSGDWSDTDASILCRYLDAKQAAVDGGDFYWLHWTKQNKPAANVLWPIVSRLARQRMYVLLPDVFAAANRLTDATRLQQSIKNTLRDAYLDLASIQQDLKEHDVACQLLSEACHYDENSPAVYRARAKCLRALGKTEEAQADESKADQLDPNGQKQL